MVLTKHSPQDDSQKSIFLRAFGEFRAGHYSLCLSDLLRLSDSGDAKATYISAVIFDKGGGGVSQDMRRAREMYALSLTQSPIPGAGIALAQMLCNGRGGETDYVSARKYCEMFPSVAYAVIMLGLMKYHGSGCRKDDDAALAQFDRAWQMSHPLGLKYAALIRMSKREYIRAVPDFIRSVLMIVWYYGIRRYPLTKAPRETTSILL